MAHELVPAAAGELVATAAADDLAARWLTGYTGRTRAAYASDLRDWARWLERVDVAPLEAERAHVETYLRQLEERGRAAATVARRLTTLAGFYRYAVDEEAIARSPVSKVRRPKVDQESQTLGLDRSELGQLLAVAEASGARDYALCCLLSLNGLRVSEAVGANVEDLGHERGHRTLAITRKGGRRGVVPLAPRTAAAVDALQTGDRQVSVTSLIDGGSPRPLLVTSSGRRLDRHAALKAIVRLAKAAGISKRITPHSMRHAFVTLALDAGAQLHDVQDAAGHADPRTTRRYDRARHRLDRNPTFAVAAHVAD